MAAGDPKMADRVWKVVYSLVFVRFCQLLLNKFFDPSTHSMRKAHGGREKKNRKTNGKKKKKLRDVLQEREGATC